MSTETTEGDQHWKQQVEKQKISGLSRSQYCRENNLNYHTFNYWQKKLSTASSTFVPVKLHEPDTVPSVLCTIEVRGHLLKIHDMRALALVLERLT